MQRFKSFINKPRRLLRGTVAEYIAVAILYVGITIVLTGFVLLRPNTQLFTGGSGDATAGFLWLNHTDPGLNPVLDRTDNVNYPEGEDLGGPTFITYSALWLPLRVLSFVFGPIAGLNLMMLFGYLLSAMAGYWFLKRLTGSRLTAFFAGYAVAFVPYHIYKSVAHLAYLFSFSFVLIIASFYYLWQKPNFKRAAVFSAMVALAFYTDGYYLLIASVLVASLVVSGMILAYLQKNRGKFVRWLKMMLVSGGILTVLCIPIFYVQYSQGKQVNAMLSSSRGSDPASEMRAYRARIEDFFLPSGQHPLLKDNQNYQVVSNYKEQRSTPSESINYVGYSILILVVVGFVMISVYLLRPKDSSLRRMKAPSRTLVICFATILLVFIPIALAFMFSPAGEIKGRTIYLPGQIMADLGIGFWRVLTRFFLPLHILLTIFASIVFWLVYAKFLKKRKVARYIVALGLSAFMAFEYLTLYNTPVFDFTQLPSGYQWLKNQKDIKVIAELPFVDALDGKTGYYATAQILHGKKLVNMKEPSSNRLNNTIGGKANPEAINIAYERGAQAVVTHDEQCEKDVSWGRLAFGESGQLSPVCIYRLERPIDQDDYFVEFGEGFEYTAVRQAPYPQFARIGSSKSTINITDESLEKSVSGQASLMATIRYVSNNALPGIWSLSQDGHQIAGGTLSGQTTHIGASIDASKPVILEVVYEDSVHTPKEVDTFLDNTVVK